MDGRVDGSAIDSQVLSVMMRDHPAIRDELRIVESPRPSTIQPVAVSKRIPVRLKRQIIDVLTGLHHDPHTHQKLAFGMVERFTPVGPASYNDIRRMLSPCEEAGFLKLR